MFNIDSNIKIYLATGHTDMRKGVRSLALLASEIVSGDSNRTALFVLRGRRADKLKILWWDGQGFCLYYKCMEAGKFTWPAAEQKKPLGITKAQLSMLIEGLDWRAPKWSNYASLCWVRECNQPKYF